MTTAASEVAEVSIAGGCAPLPHPAAYPAAAKASGGGGGAGTTTIITSSTSTAAPPPPPPLVFFGASGGGPAGGAKSATLSAAATANNNSTTSVRPEQRPEHQDEDFMHDLRQVEEVVFVAPSAATATAAAAAAATGGSSRVVGGVHPWAADTEAAAAASSPVNSNSGVPPCAQAEHLPPPPPMVPPPSVPPPPSPLPPPRSLPSPLPRSSRAPLLPPRMLPEDGALYVSEVAPAAMLANGRAAVSGQRGAWALADFEIMKCLHEGYASSVFRAKCLLSGHAVVLKVYSLVDQTAFLQYQMLRELHIHARLRHQNIVPLYGSFRDDCGLVMVQQYVRGGSLLQLRRGLPGGRMSEFQVMHLVLFPLLNALVYLHGHGIVHRDIKPANLLFTSDWQLKLCDFGVAICLHEERAVTRSGSTDYMAPEVTVCPLKHLPEDNKGNTRLAYTAAVDVWSLGVLVYDLLVGFTPFPPGVPRSLRSAAGGGGEPADKLHFPSSVGEPARDFVRACLRWRPEDRPTVRQLRQHEWVTKALEDQGC